MTEEKLIKYLEYIFDCLENTGNVTLYAETQKERIKGLLDLYQKQKEELETEKHYAKVYENMVKDYEKICIEKNKRIEELEEEIDQMNKDKWEGWLEANE